MVTMTAPRDPREPDRSRDDDERFREIVAGFSDENRDDVPRWHVSEDVPTDHVEGGVGPGSEQGLEVAGSAPPETGDPGLPEWLEPAALEDEGHYEPPAPPRLPRPRLRTLAGVAVLLAGFAVLFLPFRIGLDDSAGSLLLGMLLVAAGLGLLVASVRDAPGADDRPDGGAVV